MIGVGATLNERFTLEKELGQGGMGTVYRATDQLLGRNVAIKFLKDARSENEAEQIRLEAQILARLVHDNIVRLYDLGESEGTCFLVMEEVNGPSFAKRLRDLRLDGRLRICAQVAEALHYAHIRGVIHRDVKPGNVLLTPTDEAKLSDFGLSLVTGDAKDQTWTIRGTPSYMSPEQARGSSLDHRTDLYSVGVMLYECATGDLPFAGDALAVMGQHKSAAPAPPRSKNPEIWSTLETLILSLLAKNPSKRPASGNVVALELFEEAERAQRLDRINPGLKRSDPRMPVYPPPSSTASVGNLKGEHAAKNGTGRVDTGTIEPGATDSPSPVHRFSDTTGPPPSLPRGPLTSFKTGRAKASESYGDSVAREMCEKVLATPMVLSPEERYVCGHYLAYLLGGSRRRGIFLRRPLDAKNSDRARLLLAMTWLMSAEPTQEAIDRASLLLQDRPDVRGALSPVVVMKYLASRDTKGKCRRFRQVRKRLQEASDYARRQMLDVKGVLNPGMMPRTLADLATIAPPRETLDAHRVSLWNRVTEVWREEDDFREAVLRYALRSDHLDAASADFWPEVVYPLIERAHWQRTFRPRHEAIWDYLVGKLLRIPVAGVQLDRMMVIAIPLEVAQQLDEDLLTVIDDPHLDEDETDASPTESPVTQEKRPFYVGGVIPRDERSKDDDDDDAPRVKPTVPLAQPEPFLFAQNTLHSLWEGAMETLENAPRPTVPHRTISVGPYELAVIPIGRSRQSVRAVVKGMQGGKQIEIFTPSALPREAALRKVIAIWIYQDASMAAVHLDWQYKERCILWHAPDAQQFNFDYLGELRQRLSTLSLQVPDQLEGALTKK